ncbi:unnamed protein product [Meloidogyne enterolobii]|uniref:Uncharacterized protein n=1 Tax=Meloidogyne enterolobii TaxID=390850 RepID=A0ACB1AGS9_MELEN
MALADLEAVLVKISCTSDCASSSLLTVNMETADAYGTGELALDVEHCQCPPGYQGTSCEVNDSNSLAYPRLVMQKFQFRNRNRGTGKV